MNLDNVRKKLHGPIFPTITPFKEGPDYEVDYESLKEYVDFLYDAGARAFYVMTYNGRFSLLSWDEMKKVNETVTKHAKSKDEDCVVIVADPMTNPTNVSIEFAQHAESIGADVISCIFMERYHHDDQVYDHFKAVADSTNIGILIHEQMLEGIHGRWLYSIDLFNNMGCQAHLVGVASFLPKVAFNFHDAYNKGDYETAWGIINELERPFFDIGMRFGWHPVLKSGLQNLNIMSQTERPQEQQKEVEQVLDEMRQSQYWEE